MKVGTDPDDSEMVFFCCLDEPNCGEKFLAYPSTGRYCPYCRELAKVENPDHPAVPDDYRSRELREEDA